MTFTKGNADRCPHCDRGVAVLEYKPGVVWAVIHAAPWCAPFFAAVTRVRRPIRTIEGLPPT